MPVNIPTLPLVLAGPIVRRVSKNKVAVWVALQSTASVALEVIQPANPNAPTPVASTNSQTSESVTTTQIGANLHVVLVDFDFVSAGLSSNPTSPYFYNLHFTGSLTGTLKDAGVLTPPGTAFSNDILSYPAVTSAFSAQAGLPSFVLPQSALTDVRLAQGSCRKTHADSLDATIFLDDDMANSIAQRSDPSKAAPASSRIQQLFLTGDQIYADDVGDSTLAQIVAKAQQLVGETLLIADVPVTSSDLAVGHRQPFVISQCGFTPDTDPVQTMKSHLLLFGEYCAMYLLMWSPVLWPTPFTLSSVTQIYPPPAVPGASQIIEFTNENLAITAFVATLPAARRVMANVATYMVLDDHDVTDDFYMNRKWLTQVLASKAGTTVIRNGLLAYAVFQGWGNDPDNSGPQMAPLLTALQQWATATPSFSPSDTTNLPTINKLLRIPTAVSIVAPFVFQTDADDDPSITPLDWHFSFAYDNYEILAFDTRTHRTYPIHAGATIAGSGLIPPGLMSADSINAQVPSTPPVWLDPNGGVTILVMPGPWTTLTLIEKNQREAVGQKVFTYDVELLHFNDPTFDAFIGRVAARDPDPNGAHIVVFCGDVHESYATLVKYWTSDNRNPLDPASSPGQTKASIAQLISSAIKNQSSPATFPGTLTAHYSGFRGEQLNTTRLGWIFPPAKLPPDGQPAPAFIVGAAQSTFPGTAMTATVPWSILVDPSNSTAVTELRDESTKFLSVSPGVTAPGTTPPPDLPIPTGPDWRMQRTLLPGPVSQPNVQKVDNGPSIAALTSALGNWYSGYVDVAKAGQQIVGVNNIAFVTFAWGSGPTSKSVTQQALWCNLSFDQLYNLLAPGFNLPTIIQQIKKITPVTVPLDSPGDMPTGPISLP